MTLNIAALREKLNKFNKQGTQTEALWKPTEGRHVIRIVPWKEDRGNPFIEFQFHYLGNKTYLSPITYGNRDPILEFADDLASGGTKEDWMQSRQFRPKPRTFIPIIVRGEEDKGVRFMSFGKTVYVELLSIIADPDYGDIVDVNTGRDIVVDYIPQEKSDTGFAKTTVRAKPNVTPLSSDPATVEKFLNQQPDLRAIFKEPTFEELKVALAKYLDVDTDTPPEAPSSPAPTMPQSATTAKAAAKPVKSNKDIVDEFDEVFN
jgi:hypothetical protein